MSPLAKAKGMKIAILAGGGDPDAGEEDTEPGHEDADEEATLKEIASAAKENDWEGMAQAIAAYVDACMARKEA